MSLGGGTLVVYARVEDDIRIDGHRHSIWLIDLASHIGRLIAANAASPRWSPNGSVIAFVGHSATGGSDLRVADDKGGVSRLLARVPSEPSAPAWAPDGQALAFTRFVNEPA
ncbi:TolB family protein [Lichenicoccus sp.]|uniref:TolB family protein n=1 Tax=Lichenicoccus sp. TaxID=2781899 RepID=UPI003D10BDB6